MDLERVALETVASGTGIATLRRVFGGSVGAVGDALTRYTESRLRNVGRVIEVADAKAAPGDGAIPERVALAVLNEGSYSGDPWVTEYLGGVLASSRTGVSRDDRGAHWTALISRLSTYDLRAHFIFYAVALRLLYEVRPRVNAQLREELDAFPIVIPMSDWVGAMDIVADEDDMAILVHCVNALRAESLLNLHRMGPVHDLHALGWFGAHKESIVYGITTRGVQLFLWGAGKGTIAPALFFDHDLEFYYPQPLIENLPSSRFAFAR